MDDLELVKMLSGKSTPLFVFFFAAVGVASVARFVLGWFAKEVVFPWLREWQMKRWQIILPDARKVLDVGQKTPDYFREGGPKWVDFERGYVYQRPEADLALSRLKSQRVLRMEGPPSAGKSVVALDVAYRAAKERWEVYYFARPGEALASFLDLLNHPMASRLDKAKTLAILDDAHLDIAASERLFSRVYGGLSHMRLLLVTRPLDVALAEDTQGAFSFRQHAERLDITGDLCASHMARFYVSKRFGGDISPIDLEAIAEECGNDLLVLGRYLKAWDGSSPLRMSHVRETAYGLIAADLRSMRASSADGPAVLLLVSMFSRFDIPLDRSFVRCMGLDADPLIGHRDLVCENDYLSVHHSSIAKLLTDAAQALQMPEFVDLQRRCQPFPAELFSEYVRDDPRNVCEVIIGLRSAPHALRHLLADESLHLHLAQGLQAEIKAERLGWALVVMRSVSGVDTWSIYRQVDFGRHTVNMLQSGEANRLSLFLYRVAGVSLPAARQWVEEAPPSEMASWISGLGFLRMARTLQRLRKCSERAFGEILDHLDMSAVCTAFHNENDVHSLRRALHDLARTGDGRFDVCATTRSDFTGQWKTRIVLYAGTTKAVRFVPGRKLGIPFSKSDVHRHHYKAWLTRQAKPGCSVIIDKGTVHRVVEKRGNPFPVGVVATEGDFHCGDVVAVRDENGVTHGFAVINYSSAQLHRVRGLRTADISEQVSGATARRVFDRDLFARTQAQK